MDEHCDNSESERNSFRIKKATHHYYAMTLRKTKLPVSQDDYEKRIAQIEATGITVEEKMYENTSGLHVHGLALVPNSYNFKKLRRRGWNIHMDEIYNYIGWFAYMMKDQALDPPIPEIQDKDGA